MAAALEAGAVLYLADGSVRLRILTTRPAEGELDAEVEVGGAVAWRQGLNIPGLVIELSAVPAEDLELLRLGEAAGVDLVALSFVRSPADIEAVREHTRLPLIAKIEKPQAVDCAEAILRVADCVMVARGDLGIELPIEEVPMVQKQLLKLAGELARPSITATQMLDSMVASTRPTRAEVADVANAILDGTDALMLSQETAVGHYPVGAIEMMAAIAEHTERYAYYRAWNDRRVRRDARDPAYTLAHSACVAARELHLAALVIPTLSGRSARLVSAHRPQVPIFAFSPGSGDGPPVRPDVGRPGRVDAPPPRHRGADRRLRPPGARARLVHAGRPDRDHGRAAELPAGVDEPAPDPGALRRRSGDRQIALRSAP